MALRPLLPERIETTPRAHRVWTRRLHECLKRNMLLDILLVEAPSDHNHRLQQRFTRPCNDTSLLNVCGCIALRVIQHMDARLCQRTLPTMSHLLIRHGVVDQLRLSTPPNFVWPRPTDEHRSETLQTRPNLQILSRSMLLLLLQPILKRPRHNRSAVIPPLVDNRDLRSLRIG